MKKLEGQDEVAYGRVKRGELGSRTRYFDFDQQLTKNSIVDQKSTLG